MVKQDLNPGRLAFNHSAISQVLFDLGIIIPMSGNRVSEVKEVVPCYKANKRGRAMVQTQGCLSPESMLLTSNFTDKII